MRKREGNGERQMQDRVETWICIDREKDKFKWKEQ